MASIRSARARSALITAFAGSSADARRKSCTARVADPLLSAASPCVRSWRAVAGLLRAAGGATACLGGCARGTEGADGVGEAGVAVRRAGACLVPGMRSV